LLIHFPVSARIDGIQTGIRAGIQGGDPMSRSTDGAALFPSLPSGEWTDTIETLHMWLQIVGKIRMEMCPWVNHSWSVSLYVTPRGLTTLPIPYTVGSFQIDFDFLAHQMAIATSGGTSEVVALAPMTVADFHSKTFEALGRLGIEAAISELPCEIPNPIPFSRDDVHKSYEKTHVAALHGALVGAARAMGRFRTRFTGKVSPVHLFWGAFDLAVTRFSGRKAPVHPGGIPHLSDEVTREAYSHEVSSCGFWVGNRDAPDPMFYAYAYPTPDGFADAGVEPAGATWVKDLGEFVLPYEAVRQAADPESALDSFFQSTYEAAADLAGWDREALEWERDYRPLRRRKASR
jgi:hypothetical protein